MHFLWHLLCLRYFFDVSLRRFAFCSLFICAAVAGHEFFEQIPHLLLRFGFLQPFQTAFEALGIYRLQWRYVDFLVFGLLRAFFGGEQLFVELLACSEAGHGDLDVFAELESVQFDEVFGEVENLDGRTHVQEEDFAALGLGASLQYELHGFGDGHEIAGHLGMGHCHGAACGDLLFKQRHDAAAAAEDVAEAHGGVAGLAALVDFEQYEFGDAFGRTHDAGGIDGFVAGDEHEAFAVVAVGTFHDVLSAEDVILDGFFGLQLHEGHVLMGGGVEDDGGPVAGEDALQALLVAHVADDGDIVFARVFGEQLLVDLVDAVLAASEQNELLGSGEGYLAAELGADGAACAGDEDSAALQVGGDFLQVELDGFAPQEVFKRDVAQLIECDFAVDELVEPGHDLDFAAGAAASRRDAAHNAAFGGGNRDDDFFRLRFLYDAFDFLARSQYGRAEQQAAALARIVVYITGDNAAFPAAMLGDLPREHCARVFRADDQHARRALCLDGLLAKAHRLDQQTAETNAADVERPNQRVDASRHRHPPVEAARKQQRAPDGNGADDGE